MGTKDARVDGYIAKAADFAKPILTQLRKTVHQACPDVEETMKWSFPHFVYHGMLAGMASFKEHCAFGFWKGRLIVSPDDNRAREAMGHFGRITALSDLPPKRVLMGYLKKAMQLNEEGIKLERRSPTSRKPLPVPPELKRALARNTKAAARFESFSPSHRREYSEWIGEAKSEETRQRRLNTAVEWMAEGKPRDWKYTRK
jgi:uncharacterized protein YdeI (YjbR/CyaY-like superfamily)